MQSIAKEFSGYFLVGEERYAYSCDGHIVKFMRTKSDSGIFSPPIITNRSIHIVADTCIYGSDDSGFRIAMLLPKEASISVSSTSDIKTAFIPLIIKSAGNASGFYDILTSDWNQYDSIIFSGGTINTLFNPKCAAVKLTNIEDVSSAINSGTTHPIEIKLASEYTHETPFSWSDEKSTIKLSVSLTRGDLNTETCDLGMLTSYLRIDFDKPQDYVTIYRRTRTISKLLALLVRQNNVVFETSLKQKAKAGGYTDSGICKTFFSDEEPCNLKWHNAIQLDAILPCVPDLIELINEGKAEALLALLPDSNRDRNRISIHHVIDICAALEAEYKQLSSPSPQQRDGLLESLREAIKQTIKGFAANHPEEIDVHKQTTIGSCFQYLDYTLKDKIYHLYLQHQSAIDAITPKLGLPPVTVEAIGEFVSVRNKKSHSDEVCWGNSAELYLLMLALLYACMFSRAQMPEELVQRIVFQLF